jgi:hypothetical protein
VFESGSERKFQSRWRDAIGRTGDHTYYGAPGNG